MLAEKFTFIVYFDMRSTSSSWDCQLFCIRYNTVFLFEFVTLNISIWITLQGFAQIFLSLANLIVHSLS